jgi:hypothetical protein
MTPRIPELQRELVAAATRQARRRTRVPARATLMAIAAGLVVAGAAGAATGVLPLTGIGTRVPTPREEQSDDLRYTSDRVVAATGMTRHAGKWRLMVAHSDQGPCLGLQAQGLNGPRSEWVPVEQSPIAESCGPRTSDFSAATWRNPDEPLAFGRAPEAASAVRVKAAGFERTAPLQEGPNTLPGDFYLVALPARVERVEVSWVDADGRAHDPIAAP